MWYYISVMELKKIMPNINRYLDDSMETIGPDEHSHEGLIVPDIIMKYGNIKARIRDLPTNINQALHTVMEIKKSYRHLKYQPEKPKTTISDEDLKDFSDYAKTLGIDGIGFTKARSSDIFSEKLLLFDNAIILTMEMKADKIVQAPSKPTMKEIFRTYLGLGIAVNKLTQFLKDRGYRAHAGPALGGEANYPLMAERAGLGCIGKHGILITPEFGPSLRLAAVYTDLENLPMNNENPYMWIRAFCDKCNRCVRKCPVGAIYKDTVVFDDGSKQHIDYKKCAIPFSNDHGCTVCVKECLFFSQGYEKIKASFLSK